jgi:Tannase and feruloyl esterase
MAPGMQHCEGGPGADVFGQFYDETPDPGVSIYAALERWFETSNPPGKIIATKYEKGKDRSSRVLFTRPLCVYPTKPKDKGTGDANDAESFSCHE